jgi:hypothetical protein
VDTFSSGFSGALLSLFPRAGPLSFNPCIDFFPVEPPLISNFGNWHFPVLRELINQVRAEFEVFGNFFDGEPLISHTVFVQQIRTDQNKLVRILKNRRAKVNWILSKDSSVTLGFNCSPVLSICFSVSQRILCDDNPLHVRGAFDDLEGLGVAVIARLIKPQHHY